MMRYAVKTSQHIVVPFTNVVPQDLRHPVLASLQMQLGAEPRAADVSL